MNKDIMHCVECNKILRKTSCDNAPVFVYDKNSDDFVSVPRDDFKDFSREHKGHHLRELSIVKDSYTGRMPYGDRRETGYLRATDGKRFFLVKKWRNNINEPLHYKIIEDGRLKVKNVKIIPQSDLIKIQMKKQFAWMDDAKINEFVKIVEHIAVKMDLESIEECFWDTGDPMIVSAKLGFREIRGILHECQKFLTWSQLKAIRDFIEENNCDNGVMTVRVQKKMSLRRLSFRGMKNRNKIVFNS